MENWTANLDGIIALFVGLATVYTVMTNPINQRITANKVTFNRDLSIQKQEFDREIELLNTEMNRRRIQDEKQWKALGVQGERIRAVEVTTDLQLSYLIPVSTALGGGVQHRADAPKTATQ